VSARRSVFPLAAPLFDVGEVTITKRAKALLKKQGVTVHGLLDRFRRLDWPEDEELFGQNVAALREGREVQVSWTFGAPRAVAWEHVSVECLLGKATIIETASEYIYRLDPKCFGPKGELSGKVWGKGVYTAPPIEIVKVAGTEEAGA
jgi:hypothetical protein